MKTLLTYLLVICSFGLFAQSLEKLDQDNGFQGLKLLQDIDTIPGFIGIFKDPDALTNKYEFAMLNSTYSYQGDDYKTFGGVEIRKMFISTVSVYITEIKVVCAHDSAVYKTLEEMYGRPTVAPRLDQNFENKKAQWSFSVWQGRNVRLVVTAKKYHNATDNEKAETPDYIYIKISSLESERFHVPQE